MVPRCPLHFLQPSFASYPEKIRIIVTNGVSCCLFAHIFLRILAATCDASELLTDASAIGDCTAELFPGTTCNQLTGGGYQCTPSSCSTEGVLAPGYCVGKCWRLFFVLIKAQPISYWLFFFVCACAYWTTQVRLGPILDLTTITR